MQMICSLKRHLDYLFLKAQALALLALGQQARALCRFDRMLVLLPMDRYALASRAHVLAQLNRLDDAVASLQQLTHVTGTPAQQAAAWFNLGYVLQQNGRHEEAGPAFEKAAEHHPCMDRAWYGLALVLIHQGRLHEARRALKKTTQLQPMSPYGWYRLAEVSLALGEPEKARQVIEHLRQFEPRVAAQLERDIGLSVHLQAHNQQGSTCDAAG
ncbi:tetratricopeptide repeat protein [Polaromonas sp.]|uniref:tetratricopeptide repeat protein n=1 Tax=Polaromonas sp. TaxID=1869339 RepID=UPI003BB5816A